jgi:hypothetical protein
MHARAPVCIPESLQCWNRNLLSVCSDSERAAQSHDRGDQTAAAGGRQRGHRVHVLRAAGACAKHEKISAVRNEQGQQNLEKHEQAGVENEAALVH